MKSLISVSLLYNLIDSLCPSYLFTPIWAVKGKLHKSAFLAHGTNNTLTSSFAHLFNKRLKKSNPEKFHIHFKLISNFLSHFYLWMIAGLEFWPLHHCLRPHIHTTPFLCRRPCSRSGELNDRQRFVWQSIQNSICDHLCTMLYWHQWHLQQNKQNLHHFLHKTILHMTLSNFKYLKSCNISKHTERFCWKVRSVCLLCSLLENLHSSTTDFWSGVTAWSLRAMATSGPTNPLLDTGLGFTEIYNLEMKNLFYW